MLIELDPDGGRYGVVDRAPKRPSHSASHPEPISPELVLVSPPHVAEEARRLLPDRPWERFAPPGVDPAQQDLAVEGFRSPEFELLPDREPQPEFDHGRGRSRRRPSFATLLFASLGILLFFTSLPIVRDAPTLEEVSAGPTKRAGSGGSGSAQGEKRSRPPASIDRKRNVRTGGKSVLPVSARPSSPSPKHAGTDPPAKKARAKVAKKPKPFSGAYLAGGFRLDFDRPTSRITSLFVSGPCGGKVVLEDIPVSADGQFVRRGASGRFEVVVQGRFAPPELVKATIRQVRPSCAAVVRSVIAQIS